MSSELDELRWSVYGHLEESRYRDLKSLILEHSAAFYIDGAVPSTVAGYKFDIELTPGAKSIRQQMPKYSLEQTKKESYHLEKEERLNKEWPWLADVRSDNAAL